MKQENMWEIDKAFNFEMGHRVWSQKLDHLHLSISGDCACKHLHGHSYEVKVFLGADTLDASAMVTDFKNLNFVKVFLDKYLDHKFMIDVNDPLFNRITGISKLAKSHITHILKSHQFVSGNYFVDDEEGTDEFLDSFVLVNFVPTSENICKFLKQYIQTELGNVATVTAVELWETKKSHCRYTGD